MTGRLVARAALGLGRPAARWSAGLALLGGLAALVGLASGRGDAALTALRAGWLLLAGLAAGGLALAAAVRLAHGRWADEVLQLAEAGARFFPAALGLLVLLLAWDATAAPGGAGALAGKAALLLASTLLVVGLGARLAARAHASAEPPWRVRGAAAAYLVAFAVGLSAWPFGLAPALTGRPVFTVTPPWFFMGAFLSGVAWTALVAALRGAGSPDLRHDLGKLLFGLGLLWGYLAWSLFLPVWYGGVPGEVEALRAHAGGAAAPVAGLALAGVLLLPSVLLFPERWKRRRGPLAVAGAGSLAGLWAERLLLVGLPADGAADPVGLAVGAGVTAGLAGLFLLTVGAGLAPPEGPLVPPEQAPP